MSKLGKKPIQIPKGSTVKIDGGKLSFNGPKGSKELKINDKIFSAEILKDNLGLLFDLLYSGFSYPVLFASVLSGHSILSYSYGFEK